MSFGERLRDLRKEKNLLQSEFGSVFGLSPSGIGSYERNEREPAYHHLVAFADFFNVSIDYLMCRTDERLMVDRYIERDTFELSELLDKYTITIKGYELSADDKAKLKDVTLGVFWERLRI